MNNVFLLSLAIIAAVNILSCEQPDEGENTIKELEIIAHWKFDELSGSILYDESTNNHHGVISGAEWTFGYSGGGLKFTEGSYVSVDYSSNLQPTDSITVEAIVKFDTTISEGTMAILSITEEGGYGLLAYNGNLEIFAYINSEIEYAWETVPYEENAWYHLAGVFDGQYLRFYLNGSLKNETTVSGQISYEYPNSLQIGRDASATNIPEGDQFYGVIDEIRITGNALAPNDFLTIPE